MIFVRDHMLEYKKTGDRNLLYLEAAGGVITQYLGLNAFAPDAPPFLGATIVSETGDLWYGYPLRVILIGESVFMLRNCKGFNEICRRPKTRDLRSAYYEMLAAKAFYRAGFEIYVRPEIGVKGKDFDFVATRSRLTVNVEVTALEEKEFYETTAINALNHKRQQLPNDNPAMIVCVIPPEWEKIGKDMDEWTAEIANNFFLTGSRRVNAVIFQVERHIDTTDDQTRGSFVIVTKSFEHPNPRFPCNLASIFGRGSSSEMQLMIESSKDDPLEMQALAERMRTGEFYDWVDSLVA